MDTSNRVSTEKALQGESLRLAGNYSKAIACFSEAIKQRKGYAWAHAHRAAARGPLGNFKEAYEDLEEARDHYLDYNYEWFLGQKAELFRLWARATLVGQQEYDREYKIADNDKDLAGVPRESLEGRYMDPSGAKPLPSTVIAAFTQMSAAIRLFTKANERLTGNPWILAHRGATRTMRYWVGMPDSRFKRGCENDFALAEEDFKSAYGSNESYGWAYAFHAVLLGLRGDPAKGDPEKTIELVGRAHTNGLDRQLSILRVMMELASYYGSNGAGYEDTVRFAWNTLQLDSGEALARYFVANGLHHLAPGDADTKSAIKRARAELNGATALLLAMEGGLDCLEGKYGDACAKLKELKRHFNLDALAMVRRDPAWARVREGSGTASDRRTPHGELQKAHESYTTLFTF